MSAAAQMTIEKDVPVPTRDGTVLRADVFRPAQPGPHPVLMVHGPYGKDIHFADFNAHAYDLIDEHGPQMTWETPNPEWWVPRGYAVVRVDQRGTGHSEGRMALFSPTEWEDYYDAIEWAGVQEWSTGKVGLLGISYYAIGQWHVAALQPPHLAAIVPWEGAIDIYRDWSHHGGILSNQFTDEWWTRQITGNQSALPAGAPNPQRAVEGNAELPTELREHALRKTYYLAREVDLSKITVPVLSSGNWTSYQLHLRGNVEGYLGAGSEHKWLEIHEGNHFTPFYTEESRLYQKRFLDRFVAGDETAWQDEPPVRLTIRDPRGSFVRAESEWPIARTAWTRLYLDAERGALGAEAPGTEARVDYPAPAGGVTLFTAPFIEDVELTGPSALHVWVSADTEDMDLFVTLIDIDSEGKEVTFEDASGVGNRGPVVKGWLRVSHRELDEARSKPYRPVHPHDTRSPLTAGVPVEAAVEILPTSRVFAAGHRLGLVIQAADRTDPTRFRHNNPVDRAPFTGTNTVHTGGRYPSYLLVPVIPPKES
ncbi:CocE/NonD family hydrolase [Kitasatospora sp. NBC_01250]|uniref:CocE/NonD family hydrolase n=1 Tax=Kitasatospora sp. NBC_01250 TaxID=2903571 RepID=UPI002E36EF09|nr:CocE/NonD family hydrolase [Kitasatospora sp. NBC_01250]